MTDEAKLHAIEAQIEEVRAEAAHLGTSGTVDYLVSMAAMTRQGMRESPRGKTFLYASVFDFVVRHGRRFELAPWPALKKRGQMRECYTNATKMVFADSDLRYCEGIAYAGTIPVLHAWVLQPDGKILDPTWPDGEEYLGCVFRTKYLAKCIARRGFWGSLLDAWEEGFPLLTGAHPVSDALEERNG
jgi:hypothetical protein